MRNESDIKSEGEKMMRRAYGVGMVFVFLVIGAGFSLTGCDTPISKPAWTGGGVNTP
jgi:hypothetical protein